MAKDGAVRELQVSRKMGDLTFAIDELEKAATLLAERAKPVLSDEEKEANKIAKDSLPVPALCPLAMELEINIVRIQKVHHLLTSLAVHLEV